MANPCCLSSSTACALSVKVYTFSSAPAVKFRICPYVLSDEREGRSCSPCAGCLNCRKKICALTSASLTVISNCCPAETFLNDAAGISTSPHCICLKPTHFALSLEECSTENKRIFFPLMVHPSVFSFLQRSSVSTIKVICASCWANSGCKVMMDLPLLSQTSRANFPTVLNSELLSVSRSITS